MSIVDWSKAPEDATHWGAELDDGLYYWIEAFYKVDDNHSWQFWEDGEWKDESTDASELVMRVANLIARPVITVNTQ